MPRLDFLGVFNDDFSTTELDISVRILSTSELSDQLTAEPLLNDRTYAGCVRLPGGKSHRTVLL